MKKAEFNELKIGLYVVYWKDGSNSVASIGEDGAGKRWVAPANWPRPPKKAVCKSLHKLIRSVRWVNAREIIRQGPPDSFGFLYDLFQKGQDKEELALGQKWGAEE